MTDREPTQSRSFLIQGAVIVLSILLAFAIDAFWEAQREASDTRQSIEVIRRDLVDMLVQLEEFERFSAESARTSVEAARALSGSVPVALEDRPQVEALILRSMTRRTMRLPRAGYTDLLNTGNLAEIDNRPLRDSLVQFYEAAERSEEIVEKNSALFTDQTLKGAIVTSGLIMPLPLEDDTSMAQVAAGLLAGRDVMLRDLMGPDFPKRPARLWQLPIESPELDRVVAALIQNARGAAVGHVIARNTHERATEIIHRIDDYLGD